jgi:hypothetical protein
MPHLRNFIPPAMLGLLGISCASLSTLLYDPAAESVATDENIGVALQQYLSAREAVTDTAEAYRPYIALLPFVDDSGFRHDKWDLEDEVPGLLTTQMEKQPQWRVVPYDVVLDALASTGSHVRDNKEACDVGELLKADYVGRGTLLDYNFERLQAGDAMLGGYKSFKGTTELEITLLRVRDQAPLDTVNERSEILDRGLGLDLLGRPRRQDLEFVGLMRMDFGSEEFLKTAIGQATAEAFAAIADGLDYAIRPSGVKIEGGGANILSVEGDEIFINIGSKNGVHQGYRFRVLPGRARALNNALDPASSVAVVEIIDVIGGRLSRVQKISGRKIAADDRLQFIPLPE